MLNINDERQKKIVATAQLSYPILEDRSPRRLVHRSQACTLTRKDYRSFSHWFRTFNYYHWRQDL